MSFGLESVSLVVIKSSMDKILNSTSFIIDFLHLLLALVNESSPLIGGKKSILNSSNSNF